MTPFGLGRRRSSRLRAELRPDETVLARAEVVGGGELVATRYGLWAIPGSGEPELVPWQLVSKVRWQVPVLELTAAEVMGALAGAEWIADRPPARYELTGAGKLTDAVHHRVRAGILTSSHRDLPGGGAWLVLRRIPGRDGAVVQVRLDPGVDARAVEEPLGVLVRELESTVPPVGP